MPNLRFGGVFSSDLDAAGSCFTGILGYFENNEPSAIARRTGNFKLITEAGILHRARMMTLDYLACMLCLTFHLP